MGMEPKNLVTSWNYESAVDLAIARGSTAATAFVLGDNQFGNEMTRFTTVPLGTGAILPPAVSGLTLLVVNHGANPLQVYAQPGDTINDILGTTGVAQMASSGVLFMCFGVSKWYTLDLATGYYNASGQASLQLYSSQTLTASVTHSQGQGLVTASNVGLTVGSANDVCTLPMSQIGAEITIANLSASNAASVYPATGEQINSGGVNTLYTQALSTVIWYTCFVAGNWVTK